MKTHSRIASKLSCFAYKQLQGTNEDFKFVSRHTGMLKRKLAQGKQDLTPSPDPDHAVDQPASSMP
jgi:hypothetical protein